MGPNPTDAAAATALCTSCGLCCTGVIYDKATLGPDELDHATDLGLDPNFDPSGQAQFYFPCPRLDGTRCSVYPDRPRICGAFRCELLKKVDSGELTVGEAQALVVEAKTMIQEVRPLVVESGGPITPKWWGKLFHTWSAKARAGEANPAQGRLVLELARLNLFLDMHFRSEDQQVLKPKA